MKCTSRAAARRATSTSDISCACHWTVNEAVAKNVGRMWGSAYSVMPAAIMVRDDSPIRKPADLAGVEIGVGYRSGSHYTTIQALEPFLGRDDIKLKFGGMPWARVDAALDGDVPATTVWGPALYVCEQLGMRKIVDASFMGAFMIPPLTPVEDIERYFRALKRAQLDIDLAPEQYKPLFAKELPPRYRDRVDVRLFGPGERVVFLPYSRESFESTQRWIHERDIFESAGASDYRVGRHHVRGYWLTDDVQQPVVLTLDPPHRAITLPRKSSTQISRSKKMLSFNASSGSSAVDQHFPQRHIPGHSEALDFFLDLIDDRRLDRFS